MRPGNGKQRQVWTNNSLFLGLEWLECEYPLQNYARPLLNVSRLGKSSGIYDDAFLPEYLKPWCPCHVKRKRKIKHAIETLPQCSLANEGDIQPKWSKCWTWNLTSWSRFIRLTLDPDVLTAGLLNLPPGRSFISIQGFRLRFMGLAGGSHYFLIIFITPSRFDPTAANARAQQCSSAWTCPERLTRTRLTKAEMGKGWSVEQPLHLPTWSIKCV